jgi:hypothetical protein
MGEIVMVHDDLLHVRLHGLRRQRHRARRGDRLRPIIRSTRISKFDYLFGRFTGAFASVCLAFLAVPLAIWIGSVMPWVDPRRWALTASISTPSPKSGWRCRACS